MRERYSNKALVRALDSSFSIRGAARAIGCSDGLIRVRAKTCPEVAAAWQRNKERRAIETGAVPPPPRELPLSIPQAAAALEGLDLDEIAPEINEALEGLRSIMNDETLKGAARVSAAKALLKHGEDKLLRYGEARLREAAPPAPVAEGSEEEAAPAPAESEILTAEQVQAALRALA